MLTAWVAGKCAPNCAHERPNAFPASGRKGVYLLFRLWSLGDSNS